MGEVNEEKTCCNDAADECCQNHTEECCTDKADSNCCGDNGCEAVEVKVDHWANVQEYWETVHEHLNQAATDVHNAVSKGVTAAEPVFREKVAPVLADATSKLSELAETARKTTSEKAGLTDTDAAPVAQIGAGLAAVATGLLGLSKSLTEWLSQHATSAAEKEPKVDEETVISVPEETVEVVEEPVVTVTEEPVIVEEKFEGDNF